LERKKLKSKIIGKVKPHLFENNLIFGLSNQWIEKFKTIPSFSIKINKKGKLILESMELVQL